MGVIQRDGKGGAVAVTDVDFLVPLLIALNAFEAPNAVFGVNNEIAVLDVLERGLCACPPLVVEAGCFPAGLRCLVAAEELGG